MRIDISRSGEPTLATLIKPDDWHLHVRDGEMLFEVIGHTVERFGRAIIMSNLKPPVMTIDDAQAYLNRIMSAVPRMCNFQPLMTLYLTDNTSPAEIRRAKESGIIYGVKYYPAGATTNSDSGVTDIKKVYAVLEVMQEVGIPLLVHGEVTDPNVDVFDREAVFVDRILQPLVIRFPRLKIVMEHITTKQGVDFVMGAGPNVAGTITAHHLLYNRNEIFKGGIRPHYHCLPVLKREGHRRALVVAATSDNPKFFLGTDSAPHERKTKESACGCAGIFTAHAGIEFYAEVFELAGKLDMLEGFASFYGADFYGLPRNKETITLIKESWEVPRGYSFGDNGFIVPLRAGEKVAWKLLK